MQYVNAVIAVALLVFALVSLAAPVEALMYAVGAVLAGIAFKRWLRAWMVRVLAIATAFALFWYFGQFFMLANSLEPGWYAGGEAIHAIGLLCSGFAMIPVLSEFSCRMKADAECERGRRQFEEHNPLLNALRPSQSPRSLS